MVRTISPAADASLPAGLALAALHGEAGSPLRVCAVLRKGPGVEGHAPVVVRERLGARVMLGAICDAGGYVLQWVELWVQSVSGLAQSPAAAVGGAGVVTNHVLDEQWRRRFEAMASAEPRAVIRTGMETKHPETLDFGYSILDLDDTRGADNPKSKVPKPKSATRLCTDDVLLREHGLPPYSSSLHRYLVAEINGDQRFIPVTRSAPENEHTSPLETILDHKGTVPFNIEGGMMVVRRFEPFSFEQFLDELGGESLAPAGSGSGLSGIFSLTAFDAKEHAADGDSPLACADRLLLSRHDPHGSLVEVFHLKLRLLADAVGAVHRFVRHTQTPILDLRDESFRVGLGERACGLPRLWTARCSLVEPAEAIGMPLQGIDLLRFVRSAATPPSVYHPGAALPGEAAEGTVRCSQPVSGSAVIRVRHVVEDRSDGNVVVVQGTLTTQERMASNAPSDLVWMRVPAPAGRIDLYATLEKDAALAPGEWRFDTTTLRLPADAVTLLRDGPPSHAIEFDLIPNLSTPIDLYSLAVLAVRTLLVDQDTTLPRALDEVLSLARQVSGNSREGEAASDSRLPLTDRIRSAFASDARWVSAIGPQRLWLHQTSIEEALAVVQEDLWCEALAAIVRAIPGACVESHCRDFGDAPEGALHRVFEPFLAEIESLVVKTRSRIVMDVRANREIQEVLDLCLQQQ